MINNNVLPKIIFLFLFLFLNSINLISLGQILKKKSPKNKIKNIKPILERVEIANTNWQKYENQSKNFKNLDWEKYENTTLEETKTQLIRTSKIKRNSRFINSLNRSIVFDNEKIGPDIGWIVPNGFKWNNKYKFDFSIRGHNTRIPDPPTRKFLGWNDGDAIGLISYQFLNSKKSSFGLNLGLRSVYKGSKALGGNTRIGEGQSAGFRWDYSLSETSGFAFGAEQLIHFDSLTDSGRNIYLTFSKAWWDAKFEDETFFPLYIATAGVGTGRMAVGTIKGFCSNALDGSGTEVLTPRSLCWAPVFSLAKVYNHKFSTFFEYNSRFFLTGASFTPIQKVPVRGTVALIVSDHIDNYKLHNFSELNWVFNLSVGF